MIKIGAKSAILSTTLVFACMGMAFAQGSAVGEVVSGSGQVNRDGATSLMSPGDILFYGDGVSTTNNRVRIDLLDGGHLRVFENSSVDVNEGVLNVAASGGVCFEDFSGPVDVVVEDQSIATEVTVGGVSDGEFQENCGAVIAALGADGAASGVNSLIPEAVFAGGALLLGGGSQSAGGGALLLDQGTHGD